VASRADGLKARSATASAPPLGRVLRTSLTDYYFNSMRLVPANVAWGIGAVVIALVGLVWPIGTLLLVPLLAVPTAGCFRVAARIVRAEPDVGVGDMTWPFRHAVREALAVGIGLVVVTVVLASNVIAGLSQSEPVGWGLAVLAGWGLIAVWCGALVAWPLIVDPHRPPSGLRDRLRLAGQLVLLDPVRFGGLGIAVAVIATVSVVLTAVILTVAVTFIALVACRSVYAATDRLAIVLDGNRQ
jgi:uncharacterized membrane protein YesL